MIGHNFAQQLKSAGGSRYGLVIAAAKRARQLNNYRHSVEGAFEEDVVPPLVRPSSSDVSTALREIAEGKLEIKYPV